MPPTFSNRARLFLVARLVLIRICMKSEVNQSAFTGGILCLFSIYRKQEVPFGTFITEFSSLLFNLMQKTSPFIVTGDFNLHINDPSNPMVKQFSDVIEEFGVFRFSTTDPTHISGNVLDLYVTLKHLPD